TIGEPDPVPECARRPDRLPRLWPSSLEARSDGCRRRAAAWSVRPAPHYATFALRAGVSVFAVSRFMGSSIAMIDYHYGHLARDSREHASRSWMLSRLKEPWTLGGRRIRVTQSRSATAIPHPAESGRGERWT